MRLNESKRFDRHPNAPTNLFIDVSVEQNSNSEEERSVAVMDALAIAAEEYGPTYDIVDAPKKDRTLPGYVDGLIRGRPHHGMVPYRIYLSRAS